MRQLANAAAHVPRAAEVVVHDPEGERRLGLGRTALQRDLTQRVRVERKGREAIETVAGQDVVQRSPEHASERQHPVCAQGMATESTQPERRQERGIPQDFPQHVGDSLLQGKEVSQSFRRRPGHREESFQEAASPRGDGQGEIRRSQLDDRIEPVHADVETVAIDPVPEELPLAEAGEERGAGPRNDSRPSRTCWRTLRGSSASP